jgi:D-sedoheptulose 7-phosphate isomerase
MDKENQIEEYLKIQIESVSKLNNHTETLKKILDVLFTARDNGNRIYVMGNGGSASTSTHFVSDLLKTSIIENKKRFKAISLSDNIPVVFAWSNDVSFDSIFVEQLKNFVDKNDVVIGISGSGNSENVINAINFANKSEATTISLTGNDGGEISKISKINLTISNNDMLTIETMHLLVCHLLTTLIRNEGKPQFTY